MKLLISWCFSSLTEQWEHAVMWVRLVSATEGEWTYEAKAWVDEKEVYSETLTTMFWSKPLADLARDGWELVGVTHESTLMPSWTSGITSPTARPVQTNFFLKRRVG